MVTILKRKILDPDKLLFRQYKLTKKQRVEMIAWGAALSFFATLIGSTWYYMTTQFHYLIQYIQANGHTASLINVWGKKPWDNLPLYVDNALHHPYFAPLVSNASTATPPEWWYIARHDARHVMIGFIAALLIGSITVGLKRDQKASTVWQMIRSVPLAMVVAAVVTAVMVVFFAWHPVAGFFNSVGTGQIPYVSEFVGKGVIQLTIIGLAAGFAAKRILRHTFATIQLYSIERNIAQGDQIDGYKRFIYPPNYKRRWAYLLATKHEGKVRSKWMGIAIACLTPFLAFAVVFGFWLLYFGPAAGAS